LDVFGEAQEVKVGTCAKTPNMEDILKLTGTTNNSYNPGKYFP
jgi:hypothetical protein